MFNVSASFVEYRQHLSQYGVSVHIIEPGLFKTDMFSDQRIRKFFQQGWKEASLKVKADYGEEYVSEGQIQGHDKGQDPKCRRLAIFRAVLEIIVGGGRKFFCLPPLPQDKPLRLSTSPHPRT